LNSPAEPPTHLSCCELKTNSLVARFSTSRERAAQTKSNTTATEKQRESIH